MVIKEYMAACPGLTEAVFRGLCSPPLRPLVVRRENCSHATPLVTEVNISVGLKKKTHTIFWKNTVRLVKY